MSSSTIMRVIVVDTKLMEYYKVQSSTNNGETWQDLEESTDLITILGYVNDSVLYRTFRGFYKEDNGKIELISNY